jgi:hypothetical protein
MTRYNMMCLATFVCAKILGILGIIYGLHHPKVGGSLLGMAFVFIGITVVLCIRKMIENGRTVYVEEKIDEKNDQSCFQEEAVKT